MSSVLLLALATAVAQPAVAEARIAPAAHCLDARQTTGMYQSDDTTVVVAAGQQHYLAVSGKFFIQHFNSLAHKCAHSKHKRNSKLRQEEHKITRHPPYNPYGTCTKVP